MDTDNNHFATRIMLDSALELDLFAACAPMANLFDGDTLPTLPAPPTGPVGAVSLCGVTSFQINQAGLVHLRAYGTQIEDLWSSDRNALEAASTPVTAGWAIDQHDNDGDLFVISEETVGACLDARVTAILNSVRAVAEATAEALYAESVDVPIPRHMYGVWQTPGASATPYGTGVGHIQHMDQRGSSILRTTLSPIGPPALMPEVVAGNVQPGSPRPELWGQYPESSPPDIHPMVATGDYGMADNLAIPHRWPANDGQRIRGSCVSHWPHPRDDGSGSMLPRSADSPTTRVSFVQHLVAVTERRKRRRTTPSPLH